MRSEDILVVELIMVTPFEASIALLSEEEQLFLLRGCVLCQITRDVEAGSVRSKAEWKSCKQTLGASVTVITADVAPPEVREAMGNAPAVLARDVSGRVHLLLDEEALGRCRGSVSDFRGRLIYRARSLGLQLGLDPA